MTESDPSGFPVNDAAATEFDLREGLLLLAIWWREILCLALLGMVLGTAWYALTLEYEAAADVVVLRARTGVVFDDERFTTLPEEGRQPAAELLAGRDTLFGLASSGAVALEVSERLQEQAPDFEWAPAALLESVVAELVGVRGARDMRGQTSAMVRITARADSPSHATLIANAWAQAYVNLVNTLYAPNSAQQLASITDELVQAEQAYSAAQEELEAFVSANEARKVEQEIKTRVAVLSGYFASEIRVLNENRVTRRRLGRLVSAVKSLREQAEIGGAATLMSNGLAIQLMKVEAYVNASRMASSAASQDGRDSPDLTLDFGSLGNVHADAKSQQEDLAALDRALQSWLALLEGAIASQSANLLSTGFYSAFPADSFGGSVPPESNGAAAARNIEAHYEDIRSLEARLEALARRKKQLSSQRDRVFTALDVLRNREAEFRLAAAVSQPELRIASPAVPPPLLPAIGTHLLLPAILSSIVGVLLGFFVVSSAIYLAGGQYGCENLVAGRMYRFREKNRNKWRSCCQKDLYTVPRRLLVIHLLRRSYRHFPRAVTCVGSQ